MKINYLELYGYTRLSLNNIKRFRYEPKEIVQLILGTNGSGKSSVFLELSPNPADKDFYTKDGYKEISITHNGHDYLLKSWFSEGNQHSFIKDGIELNDGWTITVQKKKVWEEFGYNAEMHNLLTGKDKFTGMAPPLRRKLFTQLSDSNLDYALGVYNRAATRSRDITGALKLLKKRLVAEIAKIVDDQKVQSVLDYRNAIEVEIDTLYRMREQQDFSHQELQQRKHQAESDLVRHCNALFRLKGLWANKTIWLPEEYDTEIQSTRDTITSIRTQIDLLTKEHGELMENLKAYQATGGSSVQELQTRLEAVQRDKTALLDTQVLKLNWTQPEAALSALQSNVESLSETLTALPENRERLLSQANLSEARDKELAVREDLFKAEQKLQEFRHVLSHLDQLRKGEQTQCPNCHHRWILGFTPEAHEKVTRDLEAGASFVAARKKAQAELLEVVERNQAYGNLFREYARCVRTLPTLSPLWEFLAREDLVANAPRAALTVIGQAAYDLEIQRRAGLMDVEIGKTKDLLGLAIKANSQDIDKVSTRLERIDEELGILTKSLHAHNTQLTELVRTQTQVREFMVIEAKIRQYEQEYTNHHQALVKSLKNEIMSDCLRQLQIELAQQQNLLNEINLQKGIVKDIDDQIQKLTMDDEAMKLVVSALSPTEGLIAEGLLGFIHAFLRRMNAIIRKVWTYPMEVQDCNNDAEAADLDYKFPIRIKQMTKPIDDVKDGSDGQKKIIDMAFRITAAHYLGFDDWPLYFDEPDANFDDEHKQAIPRLIQQLADQTQAKQVFIISHDFAQYASFGVCDVTVLSTDNIRLTGKYNERVTFN